MTTAYDSDEPDEIIRRLFYLMTCLCEDGAQHAADGQSRNVDEQVILELGNKLHSAGQALMILADATRLLAGDQL